MPGKRTIQHIEKAADKHNKSGDKKVSEDNEHHSAKSDYKPEPGKGIRSDGSLRQELNNGLGKMFG